MLFRKQQSKLRTSICIAALSAISIQGSTGFAAVTGSQLPKTQASKLKSSKNVGTKKTTVNQTSKKSPKINKQGSTKNPVRKSNQNITTAKPIKSAPLVQAVENSNPSQSIQRVAQTPSTVETSSASNAATASTTMKLPTRTIVKRVKSPFSGAVNFTIGKDSNIDPYVKNTSDTFFEIAPSLNYKSKIGLFGDFGASVRDYSNENYSNLYKSTDSNASIGYKGDFTKTFNSTTTISGAYHHERQTNSLQGLNASGEDLGMQSRFAEGKFKQVFGIKGDILSSEIGGYYTYHNAMSKESDDAADIAGGERIFTRDFDEIGATGKLTLKAADFLDISLAPLISQTKYKELAARLPDGTKAGTNNETPLENLVKSELKTSLVFKFFDSSITPKFLIGQIADKSTGARDQIYQGVGLESEIVIEKSHEIKIAPQVMYKKTSFDNWTNAVHGITGLNPDPTDKRVDYETTGGITGSMLFTKNIGMTLSYSIAHLRSNLPDPLLVYKKEIVGTTLNINF